MRRPAIRRGSRRPARRGWRGGWPPSASRAWVIGISRSPTASTMSVGTSINGRTSRTSISVLRRMISMTPRGVNMYCSIRRRCSCGGCGPGPSNQMPHEFPVPPSRRGGGASRRRTRGPGRGEGDRRRTRRTSVRRPTPGCRRGAAVMPPTRPPSPRLRRSPAPLRARCRRRPSRPSRRGCDRRASRCPGAGPTGRCRACRS